MASICCGLSALKCCLRKHTLSPAVLCFYIFTCGEGEGKEGQRERGGNVYFKEHFLIKAVLAFVWCWGEVRAPWCKAVF